MPMKLLVKKYFRIYSANIGILFFAFLVFFLLAGQLGTRGAVPSQKEILKTRIDDLQKQIEMYRQDIDEKSKKGDASEIRAGALRKRGGETSQILFSQQSFSDYFSKIESLESFENQIKET